MSKSSQIRAIHAELSPWTVENALLTPTLKVKRWLIEQRYKTEIDALYHKQQFSRLGS